MTAGLRAFVALVVVVLLSSTAHAGPLVDRLIAVVDHRPIFLSELKERAVPHLRRIDSLAPEAVRRDVMIAELYRELLSRLIDEELVRREADKLKITVDEKEIDAAIAQLSKTNGLTPEQLQKAVLEQGLTVKQYREEVARQILEGKWVQTKLMSSPHAPKRGGNDKDYFDAIEKFRRKTLEELRERAYVEVLL